MNTRFAIHLTDADGIGNTPYSIDSKEDESDDYPVMKPFENYFA